MKASQITELPKSVDLLVIGGGITGAGVALQAAQLGLKVLLVEQQDYAWGSSSRSSKMVHGGLRYLAQGSLHLTRASLREREWFLKELPELVQRQDYIFPIYQRKNKATGRLLEGRFFVGIALWLYDWLAKFKKHYWLSLAEVQQKLPFLNTKNMKGAYLYTDAATDDSRLVMRVLHEAWAQGAQSLNYTRAVRIEALPDGLKRVWLAQSRRFEDSILEESTNEKGQANRKHQVQKQAVQAKWVVNATGAWVEQFSTDTSPFKIRPLRGSHLVFPAEKFPVDAAVSLLHPVDQRLVFVFPWQGCTLVGTTDLDHQQATPEASASAEEIEYLFVCIEHYFKELSLSTEDLISTQAGVRPIVIPTNRKGFGFKTKKSQTKQTPVKPSDESRDHQIWQSEGVFHISGGKLTTFRTMALDTLLVAGLLKPIHYRWMLKHPPAFQKNTIPEQVVASLTLINHATEQDLAQADRIEALYFLWHWQITHEQVVHLDDLMLRRTHLGNLLPKGGVALLEQHQDWLKERLAWDQITWQQELTRYQRIYARYYAPPEAVFLLDSAE